MLRLDDHWVWDSWIADDGDTFHLFFLKAPRSLGDPFARHTGARIGHASSEDLVTWTVHPDALTPDPAGWDDVALWTGSVLRGDDGLWRMYYTAISSRGYGVRDQRVGLAVSEDLMSWRRATDAPVLEVDTRWYKSLVENPAASETWRDPLVFKDPEGDGWHMLVTARAKGAARNDDGVLGHARSSDMVTWEVGPPVSEPGAGFGQLEVPQVKVVDGQPLLVFTCHPQEMTGERRRRSGNYCTWSVAGASLLGPWAVDSAQPLTAEPDLFAAPLVKRRDGSWALVGFRNQEPKGLLSFEIIDPVPVCLEDGVLVGAGQGVSPP
jgi:beta-fructofuranosidase